MRFLRPYLALLVLALIAFWPLVLHPTETLYSNHSDLLAQHIPAKYFLVRSLRETGELPLWNPEQYAGSPFVHDIQVGLFYPPNLPLYFISEPAIGPFVSWLVFVHVLLAGWFMYAYSRHAGLGELAAFVAAVGYMLSPRWMLQLFEAGHTVTQGICWLPLILLCVERAIIRRRWSWAVGGGVAYALLILGTHPQWTLYASLLIGLWPLRLLGERSEASLLRKRGEEAAESATTLQADYGEPGRVSAGSARPGSERLPGQALPALTRPGSPSIVNESPSRRAILVRWFLAETILVTIGLALCAVQLLPTMEAAGESSRAKGMGQSWSLDGAKAAATTLIGPIPDRQIEPIHWETRGCIAFTWAVMAVVGARLGGRRALVPTMIALGMLAYALGGSYFIDRLPGFNNFRMPTRMLLTLGFPVAFLAGLGVQSLGHEKTKATLRIASAFWAIVLLNFVTVEFLRPTRASAISNLWIAYALLVGVPWTILLAKLRWRPEFLAGAVSLLMIADLLIVDVQYPDSRPIDEIYPRSPIIDYIREHNPDGHRVYDEELDGSYHVSLLGPGSPAASVHGVSSIRGFNPLDVARYRQFLAFVANIGDRQQALAGQFTHPVTTDFAMPNWTLYKLLGVRFHVSSIEPKTLSWLARLLGELPEYSAFFKKNVLRADPSPRSYDFLIGMQILPAQYLYEEANVMPRAFVVTHAIRQEVDEPDVLAQLKNVDFRTTGLIEPFHSEMPKLPRAESSPGPATIRSHKPNEVIIGLNGKTAGLLVLTDPWYPGWVCRVDGQEVPIWKADYAFRGVMVSEGSRDVVFHFEPQSYRRGKWISIATLVLIGLFFVARFLTQRRGGAEEESLRLRASA